MRANWGWAGGRMWDLGWPCPLGGQGKGPQKVGRGPIGALIGPVDHCSARRWFQSLAFYTMRRLPSTSLPSREGRSPDLLFPVLCCPRERRPRECSEDGGGGGGSGCWAGPREGMLVALGALYVPLPIPQAALPDGNTGTSEFLPSILFQPAQASAILLSPAANADGSRKA